MTKRLALLLPPLLAAGAIAVPGWAGTTATTELVSVSSTGEQGSDQSLGPSISANGRYVAFESDASNLVPGDGNGKRDVFVRDLDAHQTRLVSVSSSGVQGNRNSGSPSISADGRFVAFSSLAGSLVRGDTGTKNDIFVRDLKANTTRRVSVSSAGVQGDNGSFGPSISASGRYVAFGSDANNLVPGDTNGVPDIFVSDPSRHTIVRASVTSAGAQASRSSFGTLGASISGNGRYVAFESTAGNLAPRDTNRFYDVFVRDLKTHRTRLVSRSSVRRKRAGVGMDPSISANGRWVAFSSPSKLVPADKNTRWDIYVRDLKKHSLRLVSLSSSGRQGDGDNYLPSISASGRYVAFYTQANNLVSGDTNRKIDVLVRDLKAGTTARVSVNSTGDQGDAASGDPSISGDGRFVAFDSQADNLVPVDTNGQIDDVFRRGPLHP